MDYNKYYTTHGECHTKVLRQLLDEIYKNKINYNEDGCYNDCRFYDLVYMLNHGLMTKGGKLINKYTYENAHELLQECLEYHKYGRHYDYLSLKPFGKDNFINDSDRFDFVKCLKNEDRYSSWDRIYQWFYKEELEFLMYKYFDCNTMKWIDSKRKLKRRKWILLNIFQY